MSRDFELDQNLSGDFQKNFSSDLNEIWYVGRGRWVMHDGMPYGRICSAEVMTDIRIKMNFGGSTISGYHFIWLFSRFNCFEFVELFEQFFDHRSIAPS